jgi:hypothetical protein
VDSFRRNASSHLVLFGFCFSLQIYLMNLVDQLRDLDTFLAKWKLNKALDAKPMIASHLAALESYRDRLPPFVLPDSNEPEFFTTPLHLACKIPDEELGWEIIKQVMKAPTQQQQRHQATDASGKTPAEVARFQSYRKLMKSLVDSGWLS